jgi:hypothetical protein
VLGGGVELRRGFEEFEFAFFGNVSGAGEERADLLVGQWLESLGGFDGLFENFQAVDAGDDDGGREVEGVMKAFNRFDDVALENDAAAHGFHADHANALLDEFGQDLVFEAAKVCVHDVQRHLDGVEVEVVFGGSFEHAKVDRGIFVAGETDEAAFASLFRFLQCFNGATVGEGTVGVFEPDDFVKLPEVEVIGLEAAEGFIELFRGLFFGAAIHFGHEKDFVAVAVAEGFAHAGFAGAIAVVVIPAIVHEGEAAVDGGAHDAEAFGFVFDFADVRSTEADAGHLFAGAAEFAFGDLAGAFGGPHARAGCGERASCHCHFHKITPCDAGVFEPGEVRLSRKLFPDVLHLQCHSKARPNREIEQLGCMLYREQRRLDLVRTGGMPVSLRGVEPGQTRRRGEFARRFAGSWGYFIW